MATTRATQAADNVLTPRELMQLRVMLEQQQGFRVEQLAALSRADAPGPLGSADDEISASLATGARAALRDVRAALQRMADGRYGRCTRCTVPLGRERLEILPQVATCVPCGRAVTPADDMRATPVGAGAASNVGGRDRSDRTR